MGFPNKLLKEILLASKQFENQKHQDKPVITVSTPDGRLHHLELSPVNVMETTKEKHQKKPNI